MTAGEPGCHACRMNGVAELPAREAVYRSASWRVAHAFDTDLPGWLVVLPMRHVASMGELTIEEAAELGVLLRALSSALTQTVGAAKAYVMFFAEAEGFAHLHVHVVPRMPDQPADERGPRIFARLGRPEGDRMSPAQMDTVAGAIRTMLSGPTSDGVELPGLARPAADF